MGIRSAKLLIAFLLIPSLVYGAAIQGKEEGSVVGYCKSIDFVGGSQTLTSSGLDCTLTSTKEINSDNINWPDIVNGLLGSAGVNWLDVEQLQPMSDKAMEFGSVTTGGDAQITVNDVNWIISNRLDANASINWINMENFASGYVMQGEADGTVNWIEVVNLIEDDALQTTMINWTSIPEDAAGKYLQYQSDGSVNWETVECGAHDAVTLAGEDYLSLSTQEITAKEINSDNINWPDIVNGLLGSAGVNWLDVEQLKSVKSSGINWQGLGDIPSSDMNWLDTQDLDTDGAVKWSNLAEGELPDSAVVSADIKNGEIVVADTAITAGRSLTWSTNDLVADAELYTDTKCVYILAPVATDDLKSIWYAKGATTITSIWCESDQTVTAMLQVDDGSPADVDGTDLTCDSTPPEDTSLDGDATLAAGDRLDLDIASVSGTPTWVSICWTATYDD